MTIQGRIFTHEGHTPIAGATIEFVDNQEIVKSDSTGYFSISKPRSFLTDPHIRITNKNTNLLKYQSGNQRNPKAMK